jgi:hypothetical protein
MTQVRTKHDEIKSHVLWSITLYPVFIIGIYAILLSIPQTHDVALWTTWENRPVELATFVFFVFGGFYGLSLAWRLGRAGHSLFVRAFYAIFSLALLFIGMEEIAWGQWFFGYETPAMLERINAQGELTLHNIRGVSGHSEAMRVAFGVAGLLGIALGYRSRFRSIGVPILLLSHFAIITIHSGIDLCADFWGVPTSLDNFTDETGEVVEMLIAMAAVTYLWLNRRTLLAA